MRWPKVGVFGHLPTCGEVRALPAPRSCALLSSSWLPKPTRQNLIFRKSEITELRKRVSPGKGSLAIFQNAAKLGPPPPHVAAFLRQAVGLQRRHAAIYFSEIPKLRNYENALAQGMGYLAIFQNAAKLGPPPPHVAAFSRQAVGPHSRRARIFSPEIPKLRNDENALAQ